MNRATPLVLAAVALLSFCAPRTVRAEDEPPKDYKPTTVSQEELDKYRDDFLARTNEKRKTGREDKAADREGVPGDLRFDPILNMAAQWMADLMAKAADNGGDAGGNGHDATKFGGPDSLKDSVQRIRYFGWPEKDNGNPGGGTEACGARVGDKEFNGGKFADGWMDGSTHYRPFYGYKNSKFGDQTFELVGYGVGKSKAGNYYGCAVFGNPQAPTVKLTDDQLKALPEQIIAEINAARANSSQTPVAADEKLTAAAQAAAQKMAEKKDTLSGDETPKSEFAGGVGNTFNKGNQLKDAKSFAEFVVTGDDPYMLQEKFKSIGVGIALDGDGVPYIAIYAGHP